ncbi:MAG: hypothetical protein ACKOUM_02875, partial [Sphingopyxis sp.]
MVDEGVARPRTGAARTMQPMAGAAMPTGAAPAPASRTETPISTSQRGQAPNSPDGQAAPVADGPRVPRMGHNAAFGADHAGATLRRLDRARLANGGAEGAGEGAGNSADATPDARPARPRAQDADGTGQNSAGEGGAGRWVL